MLFCLLLHAMVVSFYNFFQMCTLVEEGSFKLKEHFPYSMIQTVIVSSFTDGIIVIRLPVDGETSKVSLIIN